MAYLNKDEQKLFSKRIRERRLELGKSQEDVACECNEKLHERNERRNISNQRAQESLKWYQQWELGNNIKKLDKNHIKISCLAEVLKVNPEWLTGESTLKELPERGWDLYHQLTELEDKIQRQESIKDYYLKLIQKCIKLCECLPYRATYYKPHNGEITDGFLSVKYRKQKETDPPTYSIPFSKIFDWYLEMVDELAMTIIKVNQNEKSGAPYIEIDLTDYEEVDVDELLTKKK